MKLESISPMTGRVAGSAHLTKQIRVQWCAYAVAFAAMLTIGLFATPSAQAQTFKVLYSFQGKSDGGGPAGGLVIDKKGNLYGTTEGGGAHSLGTVFEVNPKRKCAVQLCHAGRRGLSFCHIGARRCGKSLRRDILRRRPQLPQRLVWNGI
jgi:uncharacterized repeat protein (TIGR03803 family)